MTDIKAYENLTARQQLNLFRNLYYNDGNATEKGIIANAINVILPEYHRQKAEIEGLTKLLRSRHRAIEFLEGRVISLPDEIRAEAFKEFAERLCEDRVSNDPVVIATKCLVKEFTEGKTDE